MSAQFPPQIKKGSVEPESGSIPILTVTATNRLARELLRQSDYKQLAAGRLSWKSAEILPIKSWLSRLWHEWLYSDHSKKAVCLLSSYQERAVWEDVIRSSACGDELFNIVETSQAVMDAWRLNCAWRLPSDCAEWGDSEDNEVFQNWAVEFLNRCEANGWLSEAQLAEFIADRIDEEVIKPPKNIAIAGFIEMDPVQQRLFESIQHKGAKLEVRQDKMTPSRFARVRLIDQKEEVRVVASWARKNLEAANSSGTQEHRIGIIVPDLNLYRSRIERVFGQEFHPLARLKPDRDVARVFNISLGFSLSEYPIVEAALLFLSINQQRISIEIASRLVRCGFIEGASEENAPRGLLDVQIRRLEEREVGLEEITILAKKNSASYSCPSLGLLFEKWQAELGKLPSVQSPSKWVLVFSALLRVVGWPGDRSLTSAEHQTVAAWNKVLSEFSDMDRVIKNISLKTAVAILQRIASNRQFQPESDSAPIQILSIFEASGFSFDQLWIMGMHDGAWPRPSGPNPFLPLRLQRRFKMPQSSPDRELEFSRILTDRMLSAAKEIVVSSPESDDSSDLRPSPLFASLPEVEITKLGILPAVDYAETLRLSSLIESIDDDTAPECRESDVRGGTAIFTYQAACPFRAFGQLRLGAKANDISGLGLNPKDRALLVHRVLERIWKRLQSHADLISVERGDLTKLVRTTVQAVVGEMSVYKRILRNSRFQAIERSRLEALVSEWLEMEKDRQPFSVVKMEEKQRVNIGGIGTEIRADRVDALEDGTLVVIDYKTGIPGSSKSIWGGDRPDEPQLPLYAVAAPSNLRGVFFGILRKGKIGFQGLARTKGHFPGVKPKDLNVPFEYVVEKWREVLERLGQKFRAGDAAVDPKKGEKTCEYCRLMAFCRINDAKQSTNSRLMRPKDVRSG